MLNEAARTSLSNEYSLVFSFTKSYVSMLEHFGLFEGMQDYPTFAEAQAAMNQSKDTMKINSGVSLVEVRSKDADGPAMAQKLLQEKVFLEPLRVRIQAIADKR